MTGKVKSLEEAMERYGNSDRNDFFSLKNDGDTAVVRFLYGGEEDLEWYIVHQVEIEGKKRWVQCPETSDCPLCKSGNKPQIKLFLQLLDDKDGKVKTWERGKKFIPKILGIINRYGNLYSRKFEIQRNGKAGSTDTTYELYPLDPDSIKLEDLEERQELLGVNGFILQKEQEDLVKIAQGTYTYEPVENPPRRPATPPAGNRDEVF